MASNPGRTFGRCKDAPQHPDDSCLAGAVRPEKTKNRPFPDRKRNVIDGGEIAEAFGQVFAFDHCAHQEAAGRSVNIWKEDVSRHAGTKTIFGVGQSDLDPKHLANSICDGLDVAWGELSLTIYLFNHSVEIFSRKGI